jgi:hypothetical protein
VKTVLISEELEAALIETAKILGKGFDQALSEAIVDYCSSTTEGTIGETFKDGVRGMDTNSESKLDVVRLTKVNTSDSEKKKKILGGEESRGEEGMQAEPSTGNSNVQKGILGYIPIQRGSTKATMARLKRNGEVVELEGSITYGIKESWVRSLATSYPHCDLLVKTKQAVDWVETNNAKKRDPERFLINWFRWDDKKELVKARETGDDHLSMLRRSNDPEDGERDNNGNRWSVFNRCWTPKESWRSRSEMERIYKGLLDAAYGSH